MARKRKCINLISGYEDRSAWRIVMCAYENGDFCLKGNIQTRTKDKIKESQRKFYLKHKGEKKKSNYKVKNLHLFNESENGNTLAVHIYVTNEGRVGKSTFLLETKENNNKRSRKTQRNHPEINEKQKSKRRKLGYRCLNKRFPNSHGHHIDKENVIFIPKELHKSIYHNVWNGKGMQEMNARAFGWIASQENLLYFIAGKKEE